MSRTSKIATKSVGARGTALRHVARSTLTIERRGSKGRFRYVDQRQRPVRDERTLGRIRGLVLPPAWTEVRICQYPTGHLQAVGRDARGRLQYRYHSQWRATRDETKYHRLLRFARALPKLRRRVDHDLRRAGLPREKVLAAIARLLETTLVRVGNEEYARSNQSYGLTTMLDRHASITGNRVRFRFRGKSGVQHDVDFRDARLARIVRNCRDLPGQELFQYLDDAGVVHDVKSGDVNEYLHESLGEEFTAKDFRTWAGTVLAAHALREVSSFTSRTEANRHIVRAIEHVAKRLGNTRAVCRKCYVHPAVIDSYLDGALVERLRAKVDSELRTQLHALSPEEGAVLALLHHSLRAPEKSRKAA